MAYKQPIKNTIIILLFSLFVIGFVLINYDFRGGMIYGYLAIASLVIYVNWSKLRKVRFK